MIEPYILAQKLFCLRGEPFDLSSYPYLRAIHNTNSPEVALFTARQIAKSTTLADKMVMKAITEPASSQIYIAPLQDQAEVFASQRLKDFLVDSPIVKDGFFTGSNVIDQVFRKRLQNNSVIACSYAQRTADRIRGRSAGTILFDEFQDIFPDVIGVIKELAFRVKNPIYWYCGTPKSMSNHMEAVRARSTGNEWAVKCTHCSKWNLSWTEKNIGARGVVCEFCSGDIDTNSGQWVSARRIDTHMGKDSRVSVEGYRIPQLIVKPIMDEPRKWIELLGKLKSYSNTQFRNEVLGLPSESGEAPTTIDQLRACCDPNRPNRLPDCRDPSLPPLTLGVDWAFNAENSYTFVTIGAWNPFPSKFDVYYWKIFRGVESDSIFQEEWITDVVRRLDIQLVCADWGAGHVQNLHLARELGPSKVMQVWHTGMQGAGSSRASRAKWEPKTQKFHLARTRVLTDTFESIRRRECRFPRAEECGEFFDHILAETLEFSPRTNIQMYSNINPDDGLHSLTYCQLGSEMLLNGSFRGLESKPLGDLGVSEADEYAANPDIDRLYVD